MSKPVDWNMTQEQYDWIASLHDYELWRMWAYWHATKSQLEAMSHFATDLFQPVLISP